MRTVFSKLKIRILNSRKEILIIFSIFPILSFSQQVADSTYNPPIKNPAYKLGKGPIVYIDEAHHNFHTKNGRYKAFANLLEKDGYIVKEFQEEFSTNELLKGKILVISNALNEVNEENWYLPTPSAFTQTEIDAIHNWVMHGGSLFLIADHMPMAGAAMNLAAKFGFGIKNGFVLDTINRGPSFFSLDEGTLNQSIITLGRDSSESVKQIATFTGQGFTIPDDATPILTFTKKYINLMPDTAWVFTPETKIENAEGLSQGAYKKIGKGKIVVFGEAAMFTAQLAGPNQVKMGMNNNVAPENYKLLLNIIHWLDGIIE